MNSILIQDAARIREASLIALEHHRELRLSLPWIPERTAEDFEPRIGWMTKEGSVYGLEEEGRLTAFLGWFPLEDFRNLGAGALTPDWCLGVAGTGDRRKVSRCLSPLFRRLMSDLSTAGLPVHGIGVPASAINLLEECSLLAYGRIVLDAAKPARELLAGLDASREESPDIRVRKATKADAQALAELDANLARHIGAAPVLMPNTRGSTSERWEDWLSDPDAVTFVAECAEPARGARREPVGFIKADPPHFDVSWFVHDSATLAICGLYVDPAHRGRNVGATLLRELAAHAVDRGYGLVSVDCETHNPEARAFWLPRFEPVSWSFERRF